MAKGLNKGLAQGREIGFKEGERNAFRTIVARLLGQSRSILEICNMTGIHEEDVREIALSLES